MTGIRTHTLTHAPEIRRRTNSIQTPRHSKRKASEVRSDSSSLCVCFRGFLTEANLLLSRESSPWRHKGLPHFFDAKFSVSHTSPRQPSFLFEMPRASRGPLPGGSAPGFLTPFLGCHGTHSPQDQHKSRLSGLLFFVPSWSAWQTCYQE